MTQKLRRPTVPQRRYTVIALRSLWEECHRELAVGLSGDTLTVPQFIDWIERRDYDLSARIDPPKYAERRVPTHYKKKGK